MARGRAGEFACAESCVFVRGARGVFCKFEPIGPLESIGAAAAFIFFAASAGTGVVAAGLVRRRVDHGFRGGQTESWVGFEGLGGSGGSLGSPGLGLFGTGLGERVAENFAALPVADGLAVDAGGAGGGCDQLTLE